MKNHCVITCLTISLLLSPILKISAQDTTVVKTGPLQSKQSIKGQVVDDLTKSPVAGASVTLQKNGAVLAGTITDVNGNFVLTSIDLGRYTLLLSNVGYEPRTLQELLVTSGKEVVVNAELTESNTQLSELLVSASRQKSSNNEMTTISSRSFVPADTRKFAGTLGDPSRMIASAPGIVSGNDSRNDIVVRGNSPNGLLWQLEGIDIPNPNHYGSLSSTGGPISLLNNNTLGRSDFYSGAFPEQYGNAVSSAFDLRLRNGNTDKHEFLAEINFAGFELGAEGPISKSSKASYLLNYRYSTVGLINAIGLSAGTGVAVPKYQDLNFKVMVPLSTKNKFSFFGMGGPSAINFLGSEIDTTKNKNAYSGENENLNTKYFKAIAGVTLETVFSKKTYGKLSLGYSHAYEKIEVDSLSAKDRTPHRYSDHKFATDRTSLGYNLVHKFDASKSFMVGVNISLIQFDLSHRLQRGTLTETLLDQDESTFLSRAYVQYKQRIGSRLSVTGGVHFQHLDLNGSMALEPRAGLKYYAGQRSMISLGYGWHAQMQSPLIYFQQTKIGNQIFFTNKELSFTKSQHLVGGYTYNLTNSLSIKSEVYFQYLSDVPVESTPSGYSSLNEGSGFGIMVKDSLVNAGSGRNFGLELTVEQSFQNGYYFLLTGSIFDSKYKGSDRIERNTAFNSKYVFNVLAGKEFKLGNNNNTLSVNAKITTVGGRYASPIDIAASQQKNYTVYDEVTAPFSQRQAAYFRADFKIGYRANFKSSTLEAGIDIQNITNNKNTYVEQYNRRTNTVQTQYQQGFFPIPYCRFTF